MFVLAGAQNDLSLGRFGSRLARDLCAFTIIADGDARRVFELKQWTGPLHGFARDGDSESSVRAVDLVGPKVRLAGDEDSGRGFIRRGRARSSSPARRRTSLGKGK
jgi:hypothetical protein